jgi:hypothetical protein
MSRLIAIALLIGCLAALAPAQSRIEFGVHAAGDRDAGYKDQAVGLSGRFLFRFGSMALDGAAEYTFHAPKVGPHAPDGKTINTRFLLRRYFFDNVYVVAGVDISKLSSVLLDTTATSGATGIGIEIKNLRLQAIYEPPDFTSGQSLSRYRIEGDYLIHQKLIHFIDYISIRPEATLVRFDRGSNTLTAERVGITISIGRFF